MYLENCKKSKDRNYTGFLSFFTYTMKFVLCIFRLVKHILNKYPISTGGILDKYVGDGPDDLSVLYYGGTAGSLDNATGEI